MKYFDGRLFGFENWLADENVVLDFIRLVQISEVAFEPGGQIYEHKQCCAEITYVVSGEGFFYTNDEVMPVRRGDIHIVSKGDRHKIIACPYEKLRYICLAFDFKDIPEKYNGICRFYDSSPKFVTTSGSDMRHMFDMLINEFYVNHKPSECALESIVKLILINAYRCFVKESEGGFSDNNICKNMTVYRIVKYIDSNIYDVKSVRKIASELSFTENYISHVFKANMGISLLAYIKKKKAEAAKGLMENKNMTLTEISELLQFDSVQSLSRAFKQEFKITPTQYLEELKD